MGVAIALRDFGLTSFAMLERSGEVGSSFIRWPKETRFITPSFPSTPFGLLDLNAVVGRTSPAEFLGEEHPSGPAYARYLQALVQELHLPVQFNVNVRRVAAVPEKNGGGFALETSHGLVRARQIVWAAGEFQYPNLSGMPGAELCLHYARVESWAALSGKQRLVIGAFESGLDAAFHLASAGKEVLVLNPAKSLATDDADPSRAISPFTRQRIAQQTDRVQIINRSRALSVRKDWRGYVVKTSAGQEWRTAEQPILATGFLGSAELCGRLFRRDKKGFIELTDDDESAATPGLFLVGAQVRHKQHIFCFIYKFRQRFGVVAAAVARRAGVEPPAEMIAAYRAERMYLDDLSCCGAACNC